MTYQLSDAQCRAFARIIDAAERRCAQEKAVRQAAQDASPDETDATAGVRPAGTTPRNRT